MLNYRTIFSIKFPFFFFFSPLFCSIIPCIFHVVLTFQSPNVAPIVRNKTGSTMKQSHFRHTSPLNAWLPSLEQCLIVVGMASSFAKNQSDLQRFPSPENVRLVTGYKTKMVNLMSNDYVQFHLDCPTSRAEKVNFTIRHAKNIAVKWTQENMFGTCRNKCFSEQDGRKKVKP